MFGKEKGEKPPKRFIVKDAQGLGFGSIEILVDTYTGVNYILPQAPYGGITPLLDAYGNIVISKREG